jgi:hypothetical protein
MERGRLLSKGRGSPEGTRDVKVTLQQMQLVDVSNDYYCFIVTAFTACPLLPWSGLL